MQYETKTLDAFPVIGIAVRTTNENGQSQRDISLLWERFFKDNIMAQIPDKESNAIYCVYTDYESDANGAYTTLLGCKVTAIQTIPEGLAALTIPCTTYQVYKSVGKLPDSVLKTWMHIWQTPVNRSFLADFDVYGAKAQDPDHAEVETYLSVH